LPKRSANYQIVSNGSAYFGHNPAFPFLKLVNFREEWQEQSTVGSLSDLIWSISKHGGCLVRSLGGEGPPYAWVVPECGLVLFAKDPWKRGEWFLMEELDWDGLGVKLPRDEEWPPA
jgi:hypothetical protein